MNIKRNNGYRNKKEVKPIKLVLDLTTLNIMCRYVLSSSSYVRTNSLMNVRKLIEKLDRSTYDNDPEKSKRVGFIRAVLEAKLDYHLTELDMVLTHANGKLSFDIDFLDYENIELNKRELEWVDQLITETLQYQFIYEKVDEVQDICTRFSASDYQHRGSIVKEFESLVDELKNDFRHAKIDNSLVDTSFSLREDEFKSAVTTTYQAETNPNRRIICGMIGLNEMVGGGFESGRVYMLLGLAGIGKSLTLLNLMTQIKKYNMNYKTKDPTKRPCIVLLTMENTVVETISRLFNMCDPNNGMMADYTLDEVLHILRSDGALSVTDESPIDIVIRYKPNKSVDTSYLYTLCEDLEDEGYEVMCLIQDHIKRIRSIDYSNDLRIELGDIVNEMKVFAADKDIPVITVSHLNRDASKIMEEGEAKGTQADLTRKLGKSNTGESFLMIDNLDCGIIVNQEFDREGNRYLCYSLVKMRGKPRRFYIAQPFVCGSTIKLVEDIGGVPAFRESLNDPKIGGTTSSRGKMSNTVSNMSNLVADIVKSGRRDDDNAFLDNPSVVDLNKINEEKEEEPERKIYCPIYFFDDVKSSVPSIDSLKSKLSKRIG